MKQVILSEHALFQMRERKIDRALAVSALIRPSREYTQLSGRRVAIRKIVRDGKPNCIIVVYEDLPRHYRVITVFISSKVKKYLQP